MLENKPPTILDALRVRPFLFLWLSQILSQLAFNILNFVLVLRVYQLSGKNTAVSALVLAFMVPQLLLALFAGAVVDRFDKKLIMLVTNIVRALLVLILFILAGQIAFFYVIAFLLAIATQFFIPAEAPMIPQLLKKDLLLPANSLFTGTMYGSIILGYILAGPGLKLFGPHMVFVLLAVFFALAGVFNSLLPSRTIKSTSQKKKGSSLAFSYTSLMKGLFDDIGHAILTVIRTKFVFFALLLLTLSQTVVIILGSLFPGYAATILSVQVEDSSLLLLAPAALGMILGSVFVAQTGRRVKERIFMMIGLLLSGVSLLFLSTLSRFDTTRTFLYITSILPIDLLHFVVGICFLLGFFNAMISIPANIIIQEKSDESLRGRIYGLFNGLSAFAAIIPVAIAGYFSDIFGVGKVMTFIAFFIVLAGILTIWKRKDIFS